MERINSKDVQSMMEAYASIYNNQEQEVISEQVVELEENRGKRAAALRAAREAESSGSTGTAPKPPMSAAGALGTTGDALGARDPGRDPVPAPASREIRGQGNRVLRRPGDPGRTSQPTTRIKPSPSPAPTSAAKPTPSPKPQPKPSPSSNLKTGNPNVVVSPKSGEETKFERRLPTSAELRAAQAARKAATAGGASKKEAEYQAVKAGVGVSKGTVKDPKIAADAARKAELAALRAKAKADTMKKKPAASAPAMRGRMGRVRNEELDVFDTIKEHLIVEHELSEDVALQLMSILDEETRVDIMEYTASMGGSEKKTTVRMTADGKEPVGDRLLRGIKDRVGGFLNRLNPNALKSRTVEPRKPLVSTQKNSYELEGELVDEGSCGSKPKKKKKGGYGK